MGSIRRLRDWLLTPPAAVPAEESQSFQAAAVGYPLAAAVHLVFVVFFLAFHVTALVASNLVATGLWLYMVALARRGHGRRSFELGMLELALGVALTVHLVGWEFGHQYFLLAAAIFTFLAPVPLRSAACISAAAAVEFVVLDLYSRGLSPTHLLPASALAAMRVFNVLATFLVAGLVAALFKHTVGRAEVALVAAHDRTESLLHDVLPSAIADRLEHHRQTIADNFPEASILFADLVGFTELSQTMSPARLVDVLNGLFTRFDELVVRRGLEKIKTIGDAYMVASGIPAARADHAQALAAFALEMRAALAAFNAEHATTLELRIGIHSGPVVAGVIGKLRFLYDLWGDSVNTASRMESHGVAGEVQVSEATYGLIRDKFVLEPRGTIEVKGKGAMRTWLIRGPRG